MDHSARGSMKTAASCVSVCESQEYQIHRQVERTLRRRHSHVLPSLLHEGRISYHMHRHCSAAQVTLTFNNVIRSERSSNPHGRMYHEPTPKKAGPNPDSLMMETVPRGVRIVCIRVERSSHPLPHAFVRQEGGVHPYKTGTKT